MKREIEAEKFGLAAPCAPYGICENPSGCTGAQAFGLSGLFHRSLLLTDTKAALSPTIRPLHTRAFLQKGIVY